MPRNTNITLRKGTASEWSTANPTLDNGEPGYDTTNKRLKIGDGSTAWNSLPYEGAVSPILSGSLLIDNYYINYSLPIISGGNSNTDHIVLFAKNGDATVFRGYLDCYYNLPLTNEYLRNFFRIFIHYRTSDVIDTVPQVTVNAVYNGTNANQVDNSKIVKVSLGGIDYWGLIVQDLASYQNPGTVIFTGYASALTDFRYGYRDAFTSVVDIEPNTTANRSVSLFKYQNLIIDGNVGIDTYTPQSALDVNGITTIPLGSAVLPSIVFSGDPNTGLFSPAADNIGLSTAGSERLRITSSGRVLIGTSTSRTAGPTDHPYFQLEGSSTAGTGSIQQIVGSTTASVSPQLLLARHRGTIGESAVVAANDSLGIIRFNGGDGSDVSSTGAQIECFVDGTPGNNDMPGRLIFSTAADGAASPTERMRIDSLGNIGIASSSPSHKLDITGTIRTRTGGIGHQDNGCYVAYPGGGSLKNTGAVQTGYIKITLPVSWTNTMLQFGVDIFEFSAQKNKTFRIAGYNHIATSTWIGESAFMDSDNDFLKYRIHFGHDGTKCAIYISKLDSSGADLGAATTWDYVQIAVKDIFASFFGDVLTWADGWTVSITTTIGTLSGNIDVSRPYRQHDTSYVFNEYGADVDFRIEGDTNANLFFIDASTDRVGIKTNAPNRDFHIAAPSRLEQSTIIGTGNQIGSYLLTVNGSTTTQSLNINNLYTLPTTDGTNGQILTTNGSGTISWSTPTSASSTIDISICNGRLTLTSNDPIGSDTASNVVYFTPYNGNRIALYDGSSWSLHTFSQLSVTAGSSGSNTNWDVFIYNNSGTLTLERVQWTNNTTRATSLALQDGIYVMSGSPNKRYIGTFRTDQTLGPMSQTADNDTSRLVWNAYNQIQKILHNTYVVTHTYATAAWRPWNNNTTLGSGRHDYVLGLPATVTVLGGGQVTFGYVSSGVDSTTAQASTNVHSGLTNTAISADGSRTLSVDAGYHYTQGLQYGVSASSTFYNLVMQTVILG